MGERGKARYTFISAGSNTTVGTGARTLYRVHVSPANGTTVRIDDATDLGATPNLNATDTATIAATGVFANTAPGVIDFGPGVGTNIGITLAATSNAKLTVVWD